MRILFVPFATATLYVSFVLCDLSPECQAWFDLETYVRKKSDVLTCIRNSDCTGMNCSGSVEGMNYHTSMEINHCRNPTSVTLFADVPQLGIHSWNKTVTHGDTFELSGNIAVEIALKKDAKKFDIGLKLKLSSQQYFPPGLFSAPFEKEGFHNIVIPVPACESLQSASMASAESLLRTEQTAASVEKSEAAKPSGNCTIIRVSCPPEEMCLQLNQSYNDDGMCVCIPSYSRNERGLCIYTPDTSTVAGLTNDTASSESSSGTSGSVIATSVSISVCVILLLIVSAYAVVRLRIFQSLRRLLRVRVYEQVLLGQQEDSDEPLTDPVA